MADLLTASGVSRDFALPRTRLFGPRAVRHALRDVSFALPERGSLGIVGESGSGKTTLVRILLGLDQATAGTVTFAGRDVRPGSPRDLRWFRSDAQIVLQDPASSLDPRMTIGTSITEPLTCLNVAGNHRERVAEVLDAVQIDPSWTGRYPHELSGGQQQRVAIARALAPRPKLLVGDEPVSALDVSVRVQVLDLLGSLADQYDLSLVLVSHDLGVVRYLCDDVLVLHEGEAVEQGPTERIFADPQDPYTRQLLAAVPKLPAAETSPADNMVPGTM